MSLAQLLAEQTKLGPNGVKRQMDHRNDALSELFNQQRVETGALEIEDMKASRKQKDLLFEKDFETAKSRLETEKRKKTVMDDLDIMDDIRDNAKLFGVTKQESYVKDTIQKLQESGKANLIPVFQGMVKGDPQAAEQFKVLYQGVENDAFDLDIRERPRGLAPKIQAGKNIKTGAIEYVDFNNPDIQNTHVPPGKDITPDMEPAVNIETGKVEFVDMKNPNVAETHTPVPKNGVSFKTNPDGSVEVNMGGSGMPVDKAVGRKMQEEVIAATDSLERLKTIYDSYKPSYLTYQGKATDYFNRILSKAGGDLTPAEKASVKERRKFVQTIGREFNAYRKLITGAAASEKEMEALMQTMINENLGPVEFEASFEAYYEELQRGIRLRNKILREGLQIGETPGGMPLPGSKKFDDLYMTGSDDDAMSRGEELEAMGVPDDEILEILKKEGYQGVRP